MSIIFTGREDSGITITLPADATEQDIITAILDEWPDLADDDHRMDRLRHMAYLISTGTGDINTDQQTAWDIALHTFGLALSRPVF